MADQSTSRNVVIVHAELSPTLPRDAVLVYRQAPMLLLIHTRNHVPSVRKKRRPLHRIHRDFGIRNRSLFAEPLAKRGASQHDQGRIKLLPPRATLTSAVFSHSLEGLARDPLPRPCDHEHGGDGLSACCTLRTRMNSVGTALPTV